MKSPATLDETERAHTPPDAPLRRADRIAAACLPSIADALFVLVLFGGLLLLQGRALGIDGDIGWSLRLGQITLTSGLPRTEPLLSTIRGQPTVHWEWLAQVAYAAAYQLGGLNGVVALAALLIACTVRLLLVALQRRGTPLIVALIFTLAATGILSIDWTSRANLFSLPLTLLSSEAVWFYWRTGRRTPLVALPLLTALWANLHAGFVTVFLLLGVALAVAVLYPLRRGAARPRELLLTLVACALASLCTPWGLGLYAHMLTYTRNPLIAANTQEYQSPDFHQLAPWIFVMLLAGVLLVWHLASRPRLEHTEPPAASPETGPQPLAIAVTLLWTALALMYVRFLPLWPLLVLPPAGALIRQLGERPATGTSRGAQTWLSETLERVWKRTLALSARLGATDRLVSHGLWSALGLVVLLALVVTGGTLAGQRQPVLQAAFDTSSFPVAAAARLQRDGLPAGRGFTTYEWGGYLDYALPEYAVFIDSRSDVYPERQLRDYVTIMGLGLGWSSLLDRYSVRWALIPARAPLTQVLGRSPGWSCHPEDGDGVAVLCVRAH